jgi:hypothetical protein
MGRGVGRVVEKAVGEGIGRRALNRSQWPANEALLRPGGFLAGLAEQGGRGGRSVNAGVSGDGQNGRIVERASGIGARAPDAVSGACRERPHQLDPARAGHIRALEPCKNAVSWRKSLVCRRISGPGHMSAGPSSPRAHRARHEKCRAHPGQFRQGRGCGDWAGKATVNGGHVER